MGDYIEICICVKGECESGQSGNLGWGMCRSGCPKIHGMTKKAILDKLIIGENNATNKKRQKDKKSNGKDLW